MQTLIIIFGSPVDPKGRLFQTLVAHTQDQDNLLMFTPSAFLFRTSSTPSQILKDLKKDLESNAVCIFSGPSTALVTHGFPDDIIKGIQRMLNDQITPLSVTM